MRQIPLKGFKVKAGKVVRDERRLDVSARLRQKASKRVKVVRARMGNVPLPQYQNRRCYGGY